MNRRLALLSLLILGTAVTAQDPTGNPLYDVQYGADAIHQMYQQTFDNMRFYSSDILNEQNNELLGVVLDEISSWSANAGLVDLPEVVQTPSCGCSACGCTGGCGGAVVADPAETESDAPEQSTLPCTGCTSCGCTGGCSGAVADPNEHEANVPVQPILPCTGCTSCGCTGGCGGAVADPIETESDTPVQPSLPCTGGCTSCGCTGGCSGAVADPAEHEAAVLPILPCNGCTSCGCSNCAQNQHPIAVPEPVEVRIRRMLSNFNTESIGAATMACIDTARNTLQQRQEAILMEIDKGNYKSLELQYKAIQGLMDFNVLLDYENFYDHMSPVIYDYYNHLVNEIYPTLEILVGNLEYNRDILTVSLRGCLENISARHNL